MTTPQSILQSIDYTTKKLYELLEGSEDRWGMIERLSRLEIQCDHLTDSLERVENVLNLVVKLLSKDG